MKTFLNDFKNLVKLRLTFLVVFSASISFLIAPESQLEINWLSWLKLVIGGFLVTSAANGFNEIIEKDLDKLMKRTADRPLPSGRMTNGQALVLSLLMGIFGTYLLGSLNILTGLLSVFSILFYAFIYTPLKRKSPIAVFVGAIPGALPPLIGYVAAHGFIDDVALILFGIQFVWQFPHFWAIAWVSHADYSRVGFKLLPADKGPTKFTALQSIMYAVLMIPFGFLPYYLGLTGQISMLILLVANIFMVVQCVRLYQNMGVPAARRVMFSSYIYLPIVYLALLADKL